jgi:hypothetical protein
MPDRCPSCGMMLHAVEMKNMAALMQRDHMFGVVCACITCYALTAEDAMQGWHNKRAEQLRAVAEEKSHAD